MIGVLVDPAEHPEVREFFELFKTPWEFYRSEGDYAVLICGRGQHVTSSAKLTIVYGGEAGRYDREQKIESRPSQRAPAVLQCGAGILPIFGSCLAFPSGTAALLSERGTGEPGCVKTSSAEQTIIRIGYDLFQEVRFLLTCGQPVDYATIPTLEIHIALLRDLIVQHSIPLVEIPPVPEGFNFIACLTHDVDHVGIRNHKFDHTMAGFLYRAVIGSVINVARGRMTLAQLAQNWAAAATLPFVHLGLARDCWYQFDRYLEIERGLNSTFFVVPFKNEPGQDVNGRKPAKRATRYDVGDIAQDIQKLGQAGREVALHGLDAWLDSSRGQVEAQRVSQATGTPNPGVRMHWLCFNERSPAALERAGFPYDSTVGYNNCIGFRAGTAQAFRPPGLKSLMELPMHVMDTALFYPCYLNLSPEEARKAVNELIEKTSRFGGALTINWHDRSIAPERLWDGFYVSLLDELKRRGAWFPTAAQAVAWFKRRRSVVLEGVTWDGDAARLKTAGNPADDQSPGLRVRIHQPRKSAVSADKPDLGFERVAAELCESRN